MSVSPLAGQAAPKSILVQVPRLMTAYYTQTPDPERPEERVAFGTSGHRGVSLKSSFNEAHIAAITQAVCDYRQAQGFSGPLFMGMDPHALSDPAQVTAVEVCAANEITVMIQADLGYTPTPVISHAILAYNRGRSSGLADGVVITPSHNPPEYGGFKYNPPHGGPADTDATRWIESRANDYLRAKLTGVKRIPWQRARQLSTTVSYDYVTPYVEDLAQVIDMPAIAAAGLRLGVDPMGGSGLAYWAPIAERYGLDIHLVNDTFDPTFAFMHVDWDGKIRMDCSSPYAMAGLIALKDRFDLAFGNDPDYDRHGIVTSRGLMNPNHYLAVVIDYLLAHRPEWSPQAAVGKTLVSSSLIDRVVAAHDRRLHEVPVGFKWFVPGLRDGSCVFGGEESAGASFLRRDGTTWTTDKDGIILALAAAELTAKTQRDPGEHYQRLTERFGAPCYARVDAPASAARRQAMAKLSPEDVSADVLAGDPIRAKLTHAPGNGAAMGGLKVVSERGWFAARPSGTEDVYKIYAESFVDAAHLSQIQGEAQQIVASAMEKLGL